MFFKKKSEKEKLRCMNCESKVSDSFMFCPYCGESLVDPVEEMEDFGILGRNDMVNEEMFSPTPSQLSMTEKILNSFMSTLMKSIDQQVQKSQNDKSEVTAFPNGIKIRIGMPGQQQQPKKEEPVMKVFTDDQLKKMSGLPRTKAKMTMKRLNNKVIYELNTPGINSREDIYLAKLESGYEIKAISDKKVYVNSIPINLPLDNYSIQDNKLIVEFKAQR
ncbi:zinc-ribbon domain-containing protein [Candidatus Pacearchaeota archaeon]|nr:zinc-ribbon domain-containing protein [Candidatus Pacearchaeota archaeon]